MVVFEAISQRKSADRLGNVLWHASFMDAFYQFHFASLALAFLQPVQELAISIPRNSRLARLISFSQTAAALRLGCKMLPANYSK